MPHNCSGYLDPQNGDPAASCPGYGHDIHQSQIDIGSGKQAVRGSVQINDFLQTVVEDRIRFLMVVCLKMKVYRMHHADGIDSAVIQNDIGKGFRSEVNLLEFTVTVFSR